MVFRVGTLLFLFIALLSGCMANELAIGKINDSAHLRIINAGSESEYDKDCLISEAGKLLEDVSAENEKGLVRIKTKLFEGHEIIKQLYRSEAMVIEWLPRDTTIFLQLSKPDKVITLQKATGVYLMYQYDTKDGIARCRVHR